MMKEKLNSRKGFTLAELLIVVAILAILIAILIPVFAKSKADAILAKDAANVRSAYSEAVVKAMTDSTFDSATNKLQVNLSVVTGDYVDKSTSVTYTEASTSGSTATKGTITIKTTGATNTAGEVIELDDDVVITGFTNITSPRGTTEGA